MKVYNKGQFDKKGGCVLALGSFDALHVAHIKLIEKTVDYAKKCGIRAGVHMFDERIENVIFPLATHKSIYTNEQRAEIIENTGADFIYFEHFDEQFMNLSAFDFAKMLKNKFDVSCVVVGFHYTFGHAGEGNCEALSKYGDMLGFKTIVMPAYTIGDELVSSTKIRELIKNGDVLAISELLGRKYFLCGEVIRDRGVGRKMGLPTANIRIGEDILLPKKGVYAAYVSINKKRYACVVNVGVRPTFDLDNVSVEAHIIDFEGDLYGEKLCVHFLDYLRDEKKFDTKEDLFNQILEDIDKTKRLF